MVRKIYCTVILIRDVMYIRISLFDATIPIIIKRFMLCKNLNE
jgi:hypothetical protein